MVRQQTRYAVFAAIVAAIFGPAVAGRVLGQTAGALVAFVVAGGAAVGFAAAGVAGAVPAVACLYLGFTLRDADSDTTIDLSTGERVYVDGVARPHDETVSAPVSGEDCLGYTYAIQWEDVNVREDRATELEGADRETTRTWRDVTSGSVVVPFEVDLGSGGRLLVQDRDLATMLDDDETTVVVEADDTPPDRVQSFLEDPATAAPDGESVDLPSFDRDRKLRYRETLLLPGEDVFVMGEGTDAYAADVGPETNVDAVVGPPTREGLRGRLLDRLPERVYPFRFAVADSPMDETVGGMRAAGAFLLVLVLVAFGIAGFGASTAVAELGKIL